MFIDRSGDYHMYTMKIKKIYALVFNMKDIEESQKKMFILLIFFSVHEGRGIITCKSGESLKKGLFDEIPLYLKNTYYTPERYGLKRKLIEDYILHNDNSEQSIIETWNFKNSLLSEAENDFCNLFSDFF